MRLPVIALVAALATPVANAAAQRPHNVIPVQPFSAMLTALSAEYELALLPKLSFGVGGTSWSVGASGNELTYKSGDAKLRYYFSGEAPSGLSIGASVGYSAIRGELESGEQGTAGAASYGALAEYQLLLGANKRYVVAVGAGVKSLHIDDDKFTHKKFLTSYPTGRFSVGFAF